MFSPAFREHVREWLIELACADAAVTAAALVGSAASGREDAWSDIDLALRLAEDADPATVAHEWSTSISRTFNVADQLDIYSDATLFRVFLLAETLQVDISFWPDSRFAASGGAFQLIFGEANPPVGPTPFDVRTAVRMGWLYALHVRSSLARNRRWQAIHMLQGMRDRVLELACMRHDLPPYQGRGLDDLPSTLLHALQATLVELPADGQLHAAFGHVAEALLLEARHVDVRLATALQDPLRELVRTSRSAADH